MKKKWENGKLILVVWVGLGLVSLVPFMLFLRGSFPIFTVIWLAGPLFVVSRSSDAARVGIRRIPWRLFLFTTVINLLLLLFIFLAVEPWPHAYQGLVRGALAASQPDTTFAWLVRFKGITAWAGMLLFSGSVTIFGEELFSRGWLLQVLQHHINKPLTIAIQAVLFALP